MQVIIGTKIGMTQIIGDDGIVTPVTILQADPSTVTQIKTVETDGYNAVQLGYGQGKNLSKSVSTVRQSVRSHSEGLEKSFASKLCPNSRSETKSA